MLAAIVTKNQVNIVTLAAILRGQMKARARVHIFGLRNERILDLVFIFRSEVLMLSFSSFGYQRLPFTDQIATTTFTNIYCKTEEEQMRDLFRFFVWESMKRGP